jgi:gluconolactonase
MGSDGMTIDERGNVYLTGQGVTIFNPSGKQIAHIPIPEKWTANVTFGGSQRSQLFITASEAVYVLDMKVKGAN